MSNAPFGSVPAGQTPWMPQGQLSSPRSSPVPLIIAIAVALLALGVAVAAWLRPTHADVPASSQFTEQQIADAKKNICGAYDAMLRAIKSSGSLSSEDPNQKFMIALNSRIAFTASADYLTMVAHLNPAAPSSLIENINNLAVSYQKMILAQIEQAPKEQIDAIYTEMDSQESAVVEACK